MKLRQLVTNDTKVTTGALAGALAVLFWSVVGIDADENQVAASVTLFTLLLQAILPLPRKRKSADDVDQ